MVYGSILPLVCAISFLIMDYKKLFKTWLLIALGVLIASHISGGIYYTNTSALFLAVLLMSLSNVFLKPLLMLFALPFIILTFGLGIWLINAWLFLLVAHLVDGFVVESFGNALAGALVVSLTGAFANILFGQKHVRVSFNRPGTGHRAAAQKQSQKPLQDDDVIDV